MGLEKMGPERIPPFTQGRRLKGKRYKANSAQTLVIDHDIKVWHDEFVKIQEGSKRHEFRKNDRDYKTGQILLLRDFHPVGDKYLGGEIVARIEAISYGPEWGIPDGFCVFTIHVFDNAYRDPFDAS